ncbi:HAD hydrolase family protein [Thermogladius sp. 4427co]|uniref:HAD hydrolase family protein n=1 Tax=Thermogladius sp. 4427co TaxID=3450718 RepID=UPI003F7AA86F
MREIGLIFDYDGVLAPIGSHEPDKTLLSIVKKLSRKYFIGVASTRSTRFLIEKVPFADAFIGVHGLETVVGDYVVHPVKILSGDYSHVLKEFTALLKERCLVVEEKTTLLGKIVGIGIGWRRCGPKPWEVEVIESEAVSRGLFVQRYQRPFLEIYLAETSKAYGVRILKSIAGLREIAYFGDSENDLDAMRIVENPVFVRNEFNTYLTPGYPEVEQSRLIDYLKNLL